MRGPRLSFPGAIHHVINRFVDRHPFFKKDDDYELFLRIYYEVAESYQIKTYAYCLMSNHFHIVLQTPSGEISKFLQRFLTRVSKRMNQRMKRVGHLFQGRSKTLIVEEDRYFSTVIRYVLLNPVKACICDTIFDYPWSSVNEMMIDGGKDSISRIDLCTRLFGKDCLTWSEEKLSFQLKYWLSETNANEIEKEFITGHKGGFLSGSEFRKKILNEIERRGSEEGKSFGRRLQDRDENKKELKWEVMRKSLEKLVIEYSERLEDCNWKNQEKAFQQLSWYLAYEKGNLSYEEIRQKEYSEGKRFSVSTISSSVNRLKKTKEKKELALLFYERFSIGDLS